MSSSLMSCGKRSNWCWILLPSLLPSSLRWMNTRVPFFFFFFKKDQTIVRKEIFTPFLSHRLQSTCVRLMPLMSTLWRSSSPPSHSYQSCSTVLTFRYSVFTFCFLNLVHTGLWLKWYRIRLYTLHVLVWLTCCLALHFVQDLPEFFEDNMETWMTHFHNLLTLDNKLLQTDVSIVFLV